MLSATAAEHKTRKHGALSQEQQDRRAEGREILSAAGLAARAKKSCREVSAPAVDPTAAARVSATVASLAATLKEVEETKAKLMAAGRRLASAKGDVAGAVLQTKNIQSESYGDWGYWEERHAKSREHGETYEWYTGYPNEALREVG